MIRTMLDFLWPFWEETPDINLSAHTAAINEASWNNDIDSCLDEARRIRDQETSRNNSAGNKAQIYIAVLLGLIPVLLSLTQIEFFSQRLEVFSWSAFIGMLFFFLGVSHALFALKFSAKTMKVTAFHNVGVMDLVNLSSTENAKVDLIRQILLSVRKDRAAINRKVGFVKVTQIHIGRMVIMFLMSLLFLILWPFLSSLVINMVEITCVN